MLHHSKFVWSKWDKFFTFISNNRTRWKTALIPQAHGGTKCWGPDASQNKHFKPKQKIKNPTRNTENGLLACDHIAFLTGSN
jgi:hypothetical protein